MLLTGEPVTVCRETEGGINDDGDLIPGKLVKTVVEGCVIQDKSTGIEARVDSFQFISGVSILLPGKHDLTAEKNSLWFIARGWEWKPDGEAFEHRSAFGTFLDWTEIPVKKVRVA